MINKVIYLIEDGGAGGRPTWSFMHFRIRQSHNIDNSPKILQSIFCLFLPFPRAILSQLMYLFFIFDTSNIYSLFLPRERERERERLRKKQSFFAKFKKTWTDVLRMPKISACEKDTSCQAICHLWSVRFFNIFKSLHALSAKLESVTFPAFLTFFWRTQRTRMKPAVVGRPVIEANHLPPSRIDFQTHVSNTMSAQVDSHPSTVHLQSCFTSLFS